MKTLSEKIEVMQAALAGKKIQKLYLWNENADWIDKKDKDEWCWDGWDFRIKPEPVKPRRIYVKTHNGEITPRFTTCIAEAGIFQTYLEFIELTPEIREKLGL